MSDFLISLGIRHSGQNLLGLLKRPYGETAPEGQCFNFEWGSMAVLNDRLADNKNIITLNGKVVAWIGDLVGGISESLAIDLAERLNIFRKTENIKHMSLQNDKLFEEFNGTFAIIAADEFGFFVITDPLSFTQVFRAVRHDGQIAAFGSHADLTAIIGDSSDNLDMASITQMLMAEYCTFPNTMYTNVKELKAGCVHFMDMKEPRPVYRQLSYWSPPEEMQDACQKELADELCEILRASVEQRCLQSNVAVALSGGLDSRLVMAAIPKNTKAIGFTLCDRFNRETRTAKKVTTAYGHTWFPLVRQEEYIADNILDIVKFVGFESTFIHAHLFGFADLIRSKTNTLFTGDLFDTIIRAYCAGDFVYTRHLGGLLPADYRKTVFNSSYQPDYMIKAIIREDIIDIANVRLMDFHDENSDKNRSSPAEWFKIYPFRHWVETSTWAAHRRVLPVRLIGADRRLLNLGFKCPVSLKMGNKIFLAAAKKIYGCGLSIPSANDGVRPCSGHWWRLAQRSLRKINDGTTRMLEFLGKEQRIQHSWHNYQKYWSQSCRLRSLVQDYGRNLDQLDGVLFRRKSREILQRQDIDWNYGFRLLQLAVWLQVSKEFKTSLENGCDKTKSGLIPQIISAQH